MNFKLKPGFSALIVLLFILFTIIGTLLHEFGHIAVAKYFNYETKLYHNSMTHWPKGYVEDADYVELQNILEKYEYEIINEIDFEAKERGVFLEETLNKKYPINENHDMLVILGGPIQTILTSFLGLFILWYRDSKNKFDLGKYDWFAVFLSLFILRQIFNVVSSLYSLIFNGITDFYGDEFRVSRHLIDNQWVLPLLAMLIGSLIVWYVLFKVIPKRYQFSFILSGLIGGTIGYLVWFGFLGKIIIG